MSKLDILDYVEQKLAHAAAVNSGVNLSRDDAERIIAEIRTLRRQRAKLASLELTRSER